MTEMREQRRVQICESTLCAPALAFGMPGSALGHLHTVLLLVSCVHAGPMPLADLPHGPTGEFDLGWWLVRLLIVHDDCSVFNVTIFASST